MVADELLPFVASKVSEPGGCHQQLHHSTRQILREQGRSNALNITAGDGCHLRGQRKVDCNVDGREMARGERGGRRDAISCRDTQRQGWGSRQGQSGERGGPSCREIRLFFVTLHDVTELLLPMKLDIFVSSVDNSNSRGSLMVHDCAERRGYGAREKEGPIARNFLPHSRNHSGFACGNRDSSGGVDPACHVGNLQDFEWDMEVAKRHTMKAPLY